MQSDTRHPHQAMRKPVISEAEMAQLLTPQERKLLKGADPGFRLRHRFLLAVVFFFTARLLFFPEHMQLNLNIDVASRDLRPYFQYRALFLLMACTVYLLSYLRDWYFERVALFICAMSFTGLVMDFFNVYSWIQGPMPTPVLVLILLRIACTYALLINAIRADRAPPLPRSIFR
jgi:hypothetical protein